MIRSDSRAEADGRKVAGLGNVDSQFGSVHIEFARFDFGTKGKGTHIHISFGGQRRQYILVGQSGEIDVHFILPVEFEQLFQL